ncbi:hypothetical protein KJ641_03320 [Patescibacteria group bacterium]|nr:hypothetical protein [Patescibacteria group bacterium]MBU1895873.1 hypothetical protein [Patescibacteria group bacterium]
MFDTSQDILYLVLSLSILWFTVFLCWLLYQAARVLKNANEIIENITQKLELIADAVEFMRAKMDKVTNHMGIVSKVATGFVDKFVLGKLSEKLEEKISKMPTKANKARAKKKK